MRHPDKYPWMMFWILSVIVMVPAAVSKTCGKGWFGDNCKYKCHQTNGDCTGGCVPGWFGTDCQYADLMFTHATTWTPQVLRDGNNDTCVTDQNLQSVTLSLTEEFPFTWLRLSIKNNDLDLLQGLNVHLSGSYGQTVTCNNTRKTPYSGKVLDVYCDGDVAVQKVTLIGVGVKSLCSVSFSGGRNIALRQPATQSSTLQEYSSKAANAVDGNTDQDFFSYSCTHTVDTAPYWKVDFSHPRIVNRYVLYNRLDCCGERLKGFILTSYTEDYQQVFRYQDKETEPRDVYTVTSVGITTPVSHVVIRASRIMPDDKRPILTLCEVEIYGDCPHPTYGQDCQQTCSTNCVDGRCDSITGACDQCPPGKTGNLCDQDCPHPTYGQDCQQRCSTNCVDQRCNPENGICHHCPPGWIGDFCDQGQQVAFSVQLTQSKNLNAGERVVYDRIVTNVGDGYDAQTGIFLCPLAGLYVFHIHSLSHNDSKTLLELNHNDIYIVSIFGARHIHEAGGNTAILGLAVNDTVDVKSTDVSKLYGESETCYATFSGFLIPQIYSPQ